MDDFLPCNGVMVVMEHRKEHVHKDIHQQMGGVCQSPDIHKTLVVSRNYPVSST